MAVLQQAAEASFGDFEMGRDFEMGAEIDEIGGDILGEIPEEDASGVISGEAGESIYYDYNPYYDEYYYE